MMKALILILLPVWLYATSLSSLIEHTKKTHLSLMALEQKLGALDDAYEASRNFTNPELSLSVSDIQLNDVANRSIEPMQYQAINIKQKIPYFGKRDAASHQVQAKKETMTRALKDAKIKLIEALKITAYKIWQIEEELKITDAYIKLTNQIMKLNIAYSTSDTKYHMSIMSAELNLSQLEIKKYKSQRIREALYKKISYLSAMDVNTLEISMNISQPQSISYYQERLHENSAYKIKEAQAEEAKAEVKIKGLASHVDPVMQIGYYRRESFEDYMSAGIAFSLPLYGTERAQEEASKKVFLAAKSETADLKNALQAKLEEHYTQLQYAYKMYAIINNNALPQLNHMFDLSTASIENGADLFIYLELLQKKLSLDEQSINAVALYYKSLAALEAMTGAL